jgi:hypothetical protein
MSEILVLLNGIYGRGRSLVMSDIRKERPRM